MTMWTNPEGLKLSGRSQTQRMKAGGGLSVRCPEGAGPPGRKQLSVPREGMGLTAEGRGLSLRGWKYSGISGHCCMTL